MSIWDSLTGRTASDASKAAAADTYGKQQTAIAELNTAGDNYAGGVRDLYTPYANTGAQGNEGLSRLLQNPSSVSSLPGYQFDQNQGIQALDRSAAARGMLNSGRGSKDLLRFGTGLADKTYGDHIARLLGITGLGMQANQGIGQGLAGKLGARQTAYGGQMQAAGTIGQGDVAGAQAEQQGMQGLLASAAYLGGAALGGGAGAGASSFLGNLMKPKPQQQASTPMGFNNG